MLNKRFLGVWIPALLFKSSSEEFLILCEPRDLRTGVFSVSSWLSTSTEEADVGRMRPGQGVTGVSAKDSSGRPAVHLACSERWPIGPIHCGHWGS